MIFVILLAVRAALRVALQRRHHEAYCLIINQKAYNILNEPINTYKLCSMRSITSKGIIVPKATLKIEPATRDRLRKLSTHMDDTFDAIIVRLLDFYEEHKLKT